MEKDIRWEQRFSNYRRALAKLNKAIVVMEKNIDLNGEVEDILKEGLIQRFEYTHELAWKVMKDFAEYQGNTAITGSRDATRAAFSMGLITHEGTWMDMLASRNLTTHTYNEDIAEEIHGKITDEYITLFIDFEEKMEAIRTGKQTDIFDKE